MDLLLAFFSLLLLLPLVAGPMLFKLRFAASLLIPGIALLVYAIGFMMLTLIYKIVVNVRERMLAA